MAGQESDPAWANRQDSVSDKEGGRHPLDVGKYDNLDSDEQPESGPWNAFGLHACIKHESGPINVWLVCTPVQKAYLVGEAERDEEQTLLEAKTLEARCNQVLEDFTIKVKLAFRTGQLLPGDEIHVRLDPELRVPPYGEKWRRALSDV
jgi:hypothetical protein